MRISDWSSDVCSSDLGLDQRHALIDIGAGDDRIVDDRGRLADVVIGIAENLGIGGDFHFGRRIWDIARLLLTVCLRQERQRPILHSSPYCVCSMQPYV